MQRTPSSVALLRHHVAFLLVVLPVVCAHPAHALGPGDAAPQFAAPALSGGDPIDLADFRGRVVLLDFWASWCAPCLTSLPKLDELRHEFGASDFRVVAVNLDEDLDRARRFLSKSAIGYPSATDPKGAIPERFGLGTMPTSYLIDRKGVIRYVHEGFRSGDEDELRKWILTLLRARR